jgi:hypothetical protein
MSGKRLEALLESVADAAWIEKTNFGLETLLLDRLLPILEAGQAMREEMPSHLYLDNECSCSDCNVVKAWDAALAAVRQP